MAERKKLMELIVEPEFNKRLLKAADIIKEAVDRATDDLEDEHHRPSMMVILTALAIVDRTFSSSAMELGTVDEDDLTDIRAFMNAVIGEAIPFQKEGPGG